jgi:hypothetical protein
VGEDCIAVEARVSLSVIVAKLTSRVGLPPGFVIAEPNEKSGEVGKPEAQCSLSTAKR